MKGSRRSLDVECVYCGAAPGKSCVKGHVSPDFGSTKQPRKPHVVYPGQKPFVVKPPRPYHDPAANNNTAAILSLYMGWPS